MEQPNQTRMGRDIAISWPEIIRWAKKQSSTACLRMAQKIERIATHYHIAEALDDLVACAAQNPLIALFIIAVIASCGLPVLIFLLFVIISFLITFTGFVFIEGTILAIGSALFCAFIFSALTTLAVTASVIALMYLGLNEAYDYLQTNLSNIQHSEANIQDARVTSNEERNSI
ncbi:uncharacterized protein LOC126175688 [Schistocerca cancellata]|uniref:uncharacterized protein LOC126175688 n=2 Tax=Schistocerca TaxID=7008 RepID=UPI002117E294|nr:uncharacterized protein LOC126175688 [Schistocerca cancellata]